MNIFKKISEKRRQKRLAEFNNGGILRFFHYDFGKMRGDRLSYTVSSDNDVIILSAQRIDYEKGETITHEYEIPPVVMQQLKALLRDNGVYMWKGFDKHNSMIEGDSFVLRASFDNYSLYAEGASMLPAGFAKANEKIISFFEDMIKEA